MNDKTEDIKPKEQVYLCCTLCKQYTGVTLYNVITASGEKAKACQDHVNYFRTMKVKIKEK